jgi:hypothetical protein
MHTPAQHGYVTRPPSALQRTEKNTPSSRFLREHINNHGYEHHISTIMDMRNPMVVSRALKSLP